MLVPIPTGNGWRFVDLFVAKIFDFVQQIFGANLTAI